MKIPEIIRRLKMPATSKQEIVEACGNANESVRGTALQLLAERFPNDRDVVEILQRAALDPQNAKSVMGTISLGHLCVKLLAGMTAPGAAKAAMSLIEHWPAKDKQDLEWFLNHG